MNVDWVIAVGLFLVFVSWSFVYYTGFFLDLPDFRGGVETISEEVIEFLTVEVNDVPVVLDSGDAGSKVLYMDFYWPSGTRNSTRLFYGNQTLPCYISGNRIYWQADVNVGRNEFEMRYFPSNDSMFCDSGFSTSGANKTTPWVAEKSNAVSVSRINDMLAMDFYAFRYLLGLRSDFRVEIERSGTTDELGPKPPFGYNVYVKESPGRTENNEKVKIRVLTW